MAGAPGPEDQWGPMPMWSPPPWSAPAAQWLHRRKVLYCRAQRCGLGWPLKTLSDIRSPDKPPVIRRLPSVPSHLPPSRWVEVGRWFDVHSHPPHPLHRRVPWLPASTQPGSHWLLSISTATGLGFLARAFPVVLAVLGPPNWRAVLGASSPSQPATSQTRLYLQPHEVPHCP